VIWVALGNAGGAASLVAQSSEQGQLLAASALKHCHYAHSPMADKSKKRKLGSSNDPPQAKRPRFPQRPQHNINVLPTKNAYPNGEVNVKNFLKSHENEIKSLEHAMQAAKKGLARRAFQDVPREMRRRTASHNPQRVPKRLRVRAKQEAKEDNTPIARGKSGSGSGKGKQKHLRKEGRDRSKVKAEKRAKKREEKDDAEPMDIDGKTAEITVLKSVTKPKTRPKTSKFPCLATPATPPSRFRRRQRDKTWLPSHVWHTKRARMTDPKDPLWRFAIPLQPVAKQYRLTHRAASHRGAIAWDMSYMSTISLEGAEASIIGLLKGLHFASDEADDPWQDRGRARKWRRGTRVWEGWICAREAKPLKKIAQVTVIWCVSETNSKTRKAFIRVHPSAFLQLWNEAIRISKVQKPAVTIEDLRFEIGSIEIMGPAAAEVLCSILSPATIDPDAADTSLSLWPTLTSISDVGSLPVGALLAFDVTDPRLRDPPTTAESLQDEQPTDLLMEALSQWPVDNTQLTPSIFNRNLRLAAQRAMSSQKSINRRKSECTLGEHPAAQSTDPRIPMLLYVSRESRSWTVLLPWKWVQPIWRAVTRYPVSTGGNPRFGGLKERRQVDFERSVPLFPFDHPGTDAGWAWELRERDKRKSEWTKRPKGKRIEWSTIDLGQGRKGELGDPWTCDWERLLPKPSEESEKGLDKHAKTCSPLQQLSCRQANEMIEKHSAANDSLTTPSLFAVKITMAQRGIPTDCARIYRLPTSNPELRKQWLALLPTPSLKRQSKKQYTGYASDAPDHIKRRELARSLLEAPNMSVNPPTAGDEKYPLVPDEEDLIGFVTTGNYNLAEGMPTAVANLALHRVLDGKGDTHGVERGRVCVVRQAGSTIGRLAWWEVV
jgi:ribonuclease P/MRP protein subunit POP1